MAYHRRRLSRRSQDKPLVPLEVKKLEVEELTTKPRMSKMPQLLETSHQTKAASNRSSLRRRLSHWPIGVESWNMATFKPTQISQIKVEDSRSPCGQMAYSKLPAFLEKLRNLLIHGIICGVCCTCEHGLTQQLETPSRICLQSPVDLAKGPASIRRLTSQSGALENASACATFFSFTINATQWDKTTRRDSTFFSSSCQLFRTSSFNSGRSSSGCEIDEGPCSDGSLEEEVGDLNSRRTRRPSPRSLPSFGPSPTGPVRQKTHFRLPPPSPSLSLSLPPPSPPPSPSRWTQQAASSLSAHTHFLLFTSVSIFFGFLP
ncbi:unnamed protein product [Cyprideis torosa]|uniref:Uncharacterized protein n=1 Tax=Cyprideis torosa TaxID=163714 RepID=A0A7R8ZMT7_9CRUS|nr:unnamed protein product [Cyprideis torosa]CAG0894736.1 unnamed protein product [Cyprideis torosa]